MAVDRYLPTTHHPLYATGETPEIARRLHVEQTTLWLVNTGYRAVDVTDPWGAERLVRLAAGPFDENKSRAAQLARTVALAEFVDVLTEPGKPGIRRFSTVRYRIVEPLKNAPPAGTLIRVPGGPTINPDETSAVSTADLEMVRPGRYILYVSQLKVAAFAPRTTPVDLYGNVFGPLREADKLFVPVGESSHPEVTLEDIRGAIREQLCLENHLLISTGNNPPHRC
ncbi:MAG TPA: hypothetical protein VM913_06190 [Sphingomicrobium sp.]|jgi:hypothetical protein|nr:hypothetical protein [Sphingomicrobium sp.]